MGSFLSRWKYPTGQSMAGCYSAGAVLKARLLLLLCWNGGTIDSEVQMARAFKASLYPPLYQRSVWGDLWVYSCKRKSEQILQETIEWCEQFVVFFQIAHTVWIDWQWFYETEQCQFVQKLSLLLLHGFHGEICWAHQSLCVKHTDTITMICGCSQVNNVCLCRWVK